MIIIIIMYVVCNITILFNEALVFRIIRLRVVAKITVHKKILLQEVYILVQKLDKQTYNYYTLYIILIQLQ